MSNLEVLSDKEFLKDQYFVFLFNVGFLNCRAQGKVPTQRYQPVGCKIIWASELYVLLSDHLWKRTNLFNLQVKFKPCEIAKCR